MAQPKSVSSPEMASLLGPVLLGLPAAEASTQPATALLPLLSPILRQRVQLFSAGSQEPWIRLLSYDTASAAQLRDVARSGKIEPHPVSGEVEVDWDSDTQTQYRRLDQETLQALTVLSGIGIAFQLVYCVGDNEGGGDGWRIGEVTVPDTPLPFSSFGGQGTIGQAEQSYTEKKAQPSTLASGPSEYLSVNGISNAMEDDDDDDDDDYWARYDATPARTPATKRSPALGGSMQSSQSGPNRPSAAEDAYFAQYDSVQPAMDPHDPDEEAEQSNMDVDMRPPLGLGRVLSDESPSTAREHAELNETNGAWTLAENEDEENEDANNNNRGGLKPDQAASTTAEGENKNRNMVVDLDLAHPRPSSSAASSNSNNGGGGGGGSSGGGASQTVARLEESAAKQEQSDFGVKQHVGRSIRNLYLLARTAGIDREEFERLVRTELDVLGMIESRD